MCVPTSIARFRSTMFMRMPVLASTCSEAHDEGEKEMRGRGEKEKGVEKGGEEEERRYTK